MFQELPERFQTVFREHYPAVYRRLLTLVHDVETAKDLAQEVFIRLYRQPPENLDYVGAWLYRVSTRIAYDWLRRTSRVAALENKEFQLRLADSYEPGADALVVRDVDRDAVKQVLMRMSERDRNVLLLRYSGYSYAEIAETLGVKTELVGTIVRRALQRFQSQFVREEGMS